MVLKKIGEYDTQLLLNGEPVDTYKQSEDSQYDISASAENTNTTTLSMGFSVGYTSESGGSASFTVPASLDGYTGSVSSNGEFDELVSTNEDISFSGTFQEGDTFTCSYSGPGTDEAGVASLSVSVDIPVNPEATPSGSTQSPL